VTSSLPPRDARFHLPHVALRTRLERTTYAALVARTGLGFARRLVLLGQRVDAPDALAVGLVDLVHPPATVEPAAAALAAELAAQPAESIAEARRSFAIAAATRASLQGILTSGAVVTE
jgi:enoyl-CoA hydratase/carnithine racemase